MIIYGLTIQGKPDKVPTEVAIWLFEHNNRYPNIKFEIGVLDITDKTGTETRRYEEEILTSLRRSS